MADKHKKDSKDELEEKKKKLDERFDQLREQVLGMAQSPIGDPEVQKKRAAERLQKIRNLSFNINAHDPNNDFNEVPAYVRRNLELFESTRPDEDHITSKEIIGSISAADEEEISFANPANYLSLYFPLNDYDEDEITEIVSLLSDLYKSVGGDELEIKSIRTFEFVNQLTPELV